MRRTIVVASADPNVHEDWAACYAREDAAVIRCAGPLAFCGLKQSRSCPLLAGADVAVYDVAAVSPDFLLRLVRSRCRAALVFAHDEADAAATARSTSGRSAAAARGASNRASVAADPP